MTTIDTSFFASGIPIETAIGECRFFKVKEYRKVASDLNLMALTKGHLIDLLRQENSPEMISVARTLETLTFYQVVNSIQDVKECYERIFKLAFHKGGYELINEGTFYKMRSLILAMNCIKEEKYIPNPEVRRAIERSKRIKAIDGSAPNFDTIMTTLAMQSGSFEKVNEYTIYQMYALFYRIAQDKKHFATLLFRTVDPKMEQEDWSKNIDLFEEDSHSMSKEKFAKQSGLSGK